MLLGCRKEPPGLRWGSAHPQLIAPLCLLAGLLAGLWEFPSLPLAPGLQEEQQKEVLADHLRAWTRQPVQTQSLCFIGEVSVGPNTVRHGRCNMKDGSPFPDVTLLNPCLHAAYLGVFLSPRRLSTSSLTFTRRMWSTHCAWMGMWPWMLPRPRPAG